MVDLDFQCSGCTHLTKVHSCSSKTKFVLTVYVLSVFLTGDFRGVADRFNHIFLCAEKWISYSFSLRMSVVYLIPSFMNGQVSCARNMESDYIEYSDSVGVEKPQTDIEREIENTKSNYIWLMPFCYWRVINLEP